MYGHTSFASAGVSPPLNARLTDAFSYGTDRYSNGRARANAPLSSGISDPVAFGNDPRPAPAILIRKLPHHTSNEALSGMLIFAGDLIDTEIIRSPYQEDKGFATAVARFRTPNGAHEAQQKLHGKPNASKEANMIVEIYSSNTVSPFDRRNTIDIPTSRTQTSSASSGGSIGGAPARSRFNAAFQSSDKISPPLPSSSSGGSGEFPIPETSNHMKNLFSPQSPVANGIDDRRRVTGKSMINDDAVDDETGELLKDPVGYAQSGQQMGRRPTNPQIPIGRFASLSLSTGNGAISNGLTSPRTAPLQSPTSPIGLNSNTFNAMNYPRPQYPPINPADQNPPCNTLYVGNLPIDTNEDELKAIFSKQRGYRRLCFRTKQNGPMCFVEFEDISFATKALNELYGHPLHNSVKGGIRLSFSKNPLGVRSGQVAMNGLNSAHNAMTPHAMSPGYAGSSTPLSPGAVGASPFSSVSGPPPGLSTPPGLVNGSYRSPVTGMDAMYGGHPFALGPQDFGIAASNHAAPPTRHQTLSGGVPPTMNASYGRENGRFSDYMLGR